MTTDSEIVSKAVEVEAELEEKFRKDLSETRKSFASYFGVGKDVFTFLKDLEYYQGGYPNQDSDPRSKVLMDKFGTALTWWLSLGTNQTYIDYLKDTYGITIQWDGITANPIDAAENNDTNDKRKSLASEYLKQGCGDQKEICERADKIKIDIYEEFAAQHSGISMPRFRDIVRIAYAESIEDEAKAIKKRDDLENKKEEYEDAVEVAVVLTM